MSPIGAGRAGGTRKDPIPESVRYRWPIGEGSGTTLTESEQDQKLSVQGATWQSGTSVEGHELSFDGVDDHAGAQGPTSPGGDVSLGATVDFSTTKSSYQFVICFGGGATAGSRYVRFTDTGDIQMEVIDDSGNPHTVTTSITTGRHRVWGILDASVPEVRIAIDGSVQATASISGNFTSTTDKFALGRRANDTTGYYEGVIDEGMVDGTAVGSSYLQDDYDRQPWR